MSIGAITKQLAQEALGSQVKEVMDSFKAPEAAAPPDPENLTAVILGQVHAMQSALKDDQELAVTCTAGGTTVRVLELFAPSTKMLIVTGADAERVITRIITPAAAAQLVCRPVAWKGEPGVKAPRIRLVAPKTK